MQLTVNQPSFDIGGSSPSTPTPPEDCRSLSSVGLEHLVYTEGVTGSSPVGTTNISKMKAKLEFDLPEEQVEFNFAVNGSNWSFVVWKLDQELRGKIKYSEDITEEQREIYQEVRDRIQGFMDHYGLNWEQ